MTLPARAAALAVHLANSRIITPVSDENSFRFVVTLDETAILAALEETRREAIEEAAEIGNVIYDDAGSSSTHEVSEYRVQTALGVGALRVRDAIRALLDPPDSKRPANLATDGPDAA